MNYFNEIHAVWEPLIERVDSGRRRWNLELEVNLLATDSDLKPHGEKNRGLCVGVSSGRTDVIRDQQNNQKL